MKKTMLFVGLIVLLGFVAIGCKTSTDPTPEAKTVEAKYQGKFTSPSMPGYILTITENKCIRADPNNAHAGSNASWTAWTVGNLLYIAATSDMEFGTFTDVNTIVDFNTFTWTRVTP